MEEKKTKEEVYEIFMLVKIQTVVVWVMAPCDMVCGIIQDVDNHVRIYKVS
jgi:hypothetical protein